MNTRTDSKVARVTGSSTGFGRDTAETLARAGHRVFASMRDINGKNRIHADALRSLAAENALELSVVELDVTDNISVDRALAHVIETAGRLDVLVNNAGIASAGVSEAFTAEQFSALLDVNVLGLHRVTRAALSALRAHRAGLVVNVGSVLGRVTFPFFALYGASKFAVETLSDGYRSSCREPVSTWRWCSPAPTRRRCTPARSSRKTSRVPPATAPWPRFQLRCLRTSPRCFRPRAHPTRTMWRWSSRHSSTPLKVGAHRAR